MDLNNKNPQPEKYKKLRPIILKKQKIKKKGSDGVEYNNDNILKILRIETPLYKRSTTDTAKEFTECTQILDNSLNKYHLKYPKLDEDDRDRENKSEINNYNDKKLIKKIYSLNKNHSKKKTIKIGIKEKSYPNPSTSLGVIKNNHHIYDDINKIIFARESESFKKKIKEMQQYTFKFKTKMPKINITDTSLQNSLDVPIVNLGSKKNLLPTLANKPKNSLKLFAYYKYPNKNFPEGREQFSICLKNGEIIISGGVTSVKQFLSIWNLNIAKLIWTKIPQKDSLDNRYGHTAIALDNKLYIFGGKTKYENSSVVNGLIVFSFNDKKFNIPEQGTLKPLPRHSHVAVLIRTQIFIHGGVGENNQILNDCFILNIKPIKWHKVSIDNSYQSPKLYGHAACLVIPTLLLKHYRFNIYNFPSDEDNKKLIKIKHKGVYIFGGKSLEFGGINNELWVLAMGKKPMKWIQITNYKGNPPPARYFHTMNFYEKGNFLVVHGGRNDCISETNALDDTFLFDLENLEWCNVLIYSTMDNFKVISRYGHKSVIFSDKLIILGGMNNNNYIGSALLVINLDLDYSNEIKSNEEIEYENLEENGDEKKKEDIQEKLKMKQLGVINDIELPFIK